MSRFTIFCLIGGPWRPQPLCECYYIRMLSILVLCCSAFMFISLFCRKHATLSLSDSFFSAFLCCQRPDCYWSLCSHVIPVKYLLCSCNVCHPAASIISDGGREQCCFFRILQINCSHQRKKRIILKSHTRGGVEGLLPSTMNLLLTSDSSERGWNIQLYVYYPADECFMRT